jgi:hypothetical protein
MKITITRSGGLLGSTQQAEVHTELLEPQEALRIENAANALLPSTSSEPSGADLFQYDITISDAEGSRTLRYYGDPNPASSLIESVFKYRA